LTAQLLPWLEQSWAAIYARHKASTMPHAVLLEGPKGIGKQVFSEFVTAALLCANTSELGACGSCTPCTLFASKNHPDISTVVPASEGDVIKIDQIREVVTWLRLTPQYHSYKVAILSPAEAMNRNAANALLKTLEEPASKDLIILLTRNRSALPATVLSRCQRLNLQIKDKQVVHSWLNQQGIEDAETALAVAGGGPLQAASSVSGDLYKERMQVFSSWHDIVLGKVSVARSAEALRDVQTRVCLHHMSSWVADIVKLLADNDARILSPDLRCELSSLSKTKSAEQWFTLYDRLLLLYRTDSASFKTQAVLEGIFADIRLD